jgi:fatty-acyl-CoA synthase
MATTIATCRSNKPPIWSKNSATETELRNYARDHLAHFKCPQKIHFVPELPKTATGKVQKYVLRGKPAISKQ